MTKTIKTGFIPDRAGKTKQGSILLIAVAIVVIAAAFGAGWVWSKFTSPLTPPPEGGEMVEQPADEVVADESTLEPTIVDDPNVLTIEWTEVDGQKTRGTDYSWNSIVFGDEQILPEDGVGPKAFSLGTVKGGIYDGYELQNYIAGLSGMGVWYQSFYLLVPPAKDTTSALIVLDNYASQIGGFSAPARQKTASEILGEEGLARLGSHELNKSDALFQSIVLDSGSRIVELEQDEVVKDTQGRIFNLIGTFNRVDYPEELSFFDTVAGIELENKTILHLYNNPSQDIYFANELFYFIRQDGRTVWYNLDLGLWITSDDVEGTQSNLRGSITGVPQITWNDGTKNEKNYFGGKENGCGTVAGLNVVDISGGVELIETGLTASGEKVYEPVSYNGDYYVDSFENWKARAQDGEVRETIEQFAAAHPFFYFQDSFSRWIEFRNTEISPMAECGKPVIYLYPEKTTNLDVQLYPQGGFTYTEPVYKNGWRVTASPDGKLVNRDDGQVYPYLFWEGRGGMYVSPNRYWVVNQSGVHDFLISTLARLGLNTKETADFLEFWEPRMQSAAYYKIGFYGTNVMNQLAPLSVSEKPDTLIRILMDYEPLDVPIKSNPPVLPVTPVRNGFTVVEWGGVLR